MYGVATPDRILTAYDPDTLTLSNQTFPLEVHESSAQILGVTGGGSFEELHGTSDVYFEDFNSGLREFVAARRMVAPFVGSPLIKTGGGESDGHAEVLHVNWSDTAPLESTSSGDAFSLSDFIVST